MQLQEDIPSALVPPVEAALQWVNNNQEKNFELTGLVAYEQALQAVPGEAYELGLVLCDGDICACKQVRIEPNDSGYLVSFVETEDPGVPPLLDPPEGSRRAWLDEQLEKNDFLLLLFYRGRW